MVLEETSGPPKKKLKQAQLNFFGVTPVKERRKPENEPDKIPKEGKENEVIVIDDNTTDLKLELGEDTLLSPSSPKEIKEDKTDIHSPLKISSALFKGKEPVVKIKRLSNLEDHLDNSIEECQEAMEEETPKQDECEDSHDPKSDGTEKEAKPTQESPGPERPTESEDETNRKSNEDSEVLATPIEAEGKAPTLAENKKNPSEDSKEDTKNLQEATKEESPSSQEPMEVDPNSSWGNLDSSKASEDDSDSESSDECEETTPKHSVKKLRLDNEGVSTADSPETTNLKRKQPKTGTASTTPESRKLTPKQILKQQESEKKKMEREKLKMEKEKEKEEKLKKKQEMKEEKERLKTEEKRKKEEAKEEERRKKEEEKKVKLEAKEEEKRKKEEAKEEERRKKEEEKKNKLGAKGEEKRKKEEAKHKMESQARAVFANFLKPKKTSLPDEKEDDPKDIPDLQFQPFPVKCDMRLATVRRATLSEDGRKCLDEICNEENFSWDQKLYIEEIKSKARIPLKSEGTWPLSEEQHDVIIIESHGAESMDVDTAQEIRKKKKNKAILLQFHDNRRPPYWGTWRKKSKSVGPRRPFGKDMVVFDYEVDSDSEWEDEEEGEDLEGNDEDDKEQEEEEEGGVDENGYLLDNTFVPHGYLSDEEAQDENDDLSPEAQKMRLTFLKEEFEEEMKEKPDKLKPKLLGCVWIDNKTSEVSPGSLYDILFQYRSIWNESAGSIVPSDIEEESPRLGLGGRSIFPKEAEESLAKFVHGSSLPLSHLVKEFLQQLEKETPTVLVTKKALTRKIKSIAWRSGDGTQKQQWSVIPEVCNEYGIEKLPGTNEASPPKGPEKVEKPKDTFLANYLKSHKDPEPPKKRAQLITLPRLPPKEDAVNADKTPIVKKRATLITLPRTPEVSTKEPYVHKDTPRPPGPYKPPKESTSPQSSEKAKVKPIKSFFKPSMKKSTETSPQPSEKTPTELPTSVDLTEESL